MNRPKSIFFLVAAMLLCSIGATAQKHETLFGNSRIVGGFGGPIVEWGLNNNLNTSVGGGGGVVINQFFLGFYGMGSVDFDRLLDEFDEIEKLELGHTGLWLGVTVPSHKLIHLWSSVRLGWGAVNVDLRDPVLYNDLDKVWVVTPEIGAELNVAKWFRVAGAVGYRYLDGANSAFGYSNKDFRGTTASVTLRFGGFGRFRAKPNWD